MANQYIKLLDADKEYYEEVYYNRAVSFEEFAKILGIKPTKVRRLLGWDTGIHRDLYPVIMERLKNVPQKRYTKEDIENLRKRYSYIVDHFIERGYNRVAVREYKENRKVIDDLLKENDIKVNVITPDYSKRGSSILEIVL